MGLNYVQRYRASLPRCLTSRSLHPLVLPQSAEAFILHIIIPPPFSSSPSLRAPRVAPAPTIRLPYGKAMAISLSEGLGPDLKLGFLLGLFTLFVAHRF